MSCRPRISAWIWISSLWVLGALVLSPSPVDASSPTFIRGECNGDGQRDVADAVFALAMLFGPQPTTPPCEVACDVNDDNLLNIADPIHLLGYLFGQGTVIPAPADQCGVDPTSGGGLTCFQETGSCVGDTILGFTTLADGSASFPAQERILRDPVEWQDLWAEYASGFIPAPPQPAVDFGTEMVCGHRRAGDRAGDAPGSDRGPCVHRSPHPRSMGRDRHRAHVLPLRDHDVDIPFTIIVADLAPGDPVVSTFDGGCPP